MAGPPKGTKKSCPCIRPRLRRGSLAPVTFQGSAAKGHPWPIAALAASMPLNPFQATCARPPERGVWCGLKGCAIGDGRVTRSLPTCLQSNPPWPGKNLLEACGGKCCAVFHPTSLLWGHVMTGRSCSVIPRSASTPRVPLRNACVRLPEEDSSPGRLMDRRLTSLCFAVDFALCVSMCGLTGSTRFPFSRESGIVAQGGELHGCGERLKGPWMALVSRPLERQWSERTLRVAQGRM